MSYPDQSGGYPPPRDSESQYPPPPGEEDDRVRAYHQRAPSSGNIILPAISPYDPQYSQQPPNGYPDPRTYQQDPYRPQPGGPYQDNRGYQNEYGRGGPQHLAAFSQSAPRQRTAIACRYCRRRKIRCSGFDQNPEGRCSNCQRFQQDCIFTPVSSQAQAFVPAHAVFPNMRNMGVGPDGRPRPMVYPQGTQLFGAHGQPLGPVPPQAGSPYTEYAQSSPTGSYSSFTDDRPQQGQDRQQGSESSRKRSQQDPHPSILPPPIPGQPPYTRTESSSSRRQVAEEDLRLPPVTPTSGPQTTSNYSPGSSTSSHSNLQPPQQQSGLPSMSRTPPPRNSPGETSRGDPMSLGNIMDSRRPADTEIDRGMLGRLDRKGK